MNNRRSTSRYLCSDLVEVVFRDKLGNQQRKLANLEDISTVGICLQLEQEIESGTTVTMRCKDHIWTGTVRNSRFSEQAYFHGVEFSDDCRWSMQVFRPGYLLDLSECLRQGSMGAPSFDWQTVDEPVRK